MPALLELQRWFATGLRGAPLETGAWIEADGLSPEARIGVYANNAHAFFGQALRLTYPVTRRRVGDGYFSQLVAQYRTRYPSPSGDLHETGRAFAPFLAVHLAGSAYAWLADLARLEWAIADAATCAAGPAAEAAALGGLAADALAATRFEMVPSLRTVTSSFPVFSVWRANQVDAPAQPVDLDARPESVLLRAADGAAVLQLVPPVAVRFVDALAAGATLADAIESARLAVDALAETLSLLLSGSFVARIVPPDRSA